jgi:ribosomal protein L7/L12
MSANQLKVRVQYAVRYATLEVTNAEYDLVYALYNLTVPQKVQAIKFIRQQYGIGLKEAKDVCDAIGAAMRVPERGW